MRFTDRVTIARTTCLGTLMLVACSSPLPPWKASPPDAARSPQAPATAATSATPRLSADPVPPPAVAATGRAGLQAPTTVRTWHELRQQAARRMVAANPDGTYVGPVPEPLLAIPVLDVTLNADGSVRRIDVARSPRQAKDTIQLAKDAVHRAAPYGDVSRLPRPWVFTETFLFNDDRKFKPRTIDD